MSDVTTELAKEANDKAVQIARLKAENDKLRDGAYAMRQLYEDELKHALAENTKLHALCRDMYLVVELLDMDGARLQAHGRDADWRTLKERYNELEVTS